MYLEDIDIIHSKLLCIQEGLIEQVRYLIAFFTLRDGQIRKHFFEFEGYVFTEAMMLRTSLVSSDTYERENIYQTERGNIVRYYDGETLEYVSVILNYILQAEHKIVDIQVLSIELSSGTRIRFLAKANPPFVEFMVISEEQC